MIKIHNLKQKIVKLKGQSWHPIEVARANAQSLLLAIFQGQYHWHKHPEDELFYVLSGEITIQLKNQKNIQLTAGSVAVVPKNTWHCPKSQKISYVLMFEPRNLKSIKL